MALAAGLGLAILAAGVWIITDRLSETKTISGEGMINNPTNLGGPFELLIRKSWSTRDGVRTARETAAHAAQVGSGDQSNRAVGWYSKSAKLLVSNLTPNVAVHASGTSVTSSCKNTLNRSYVREPGSK